MREKYQNGFKYTCVRALIGFVWLRIGSMTDSCEKAINPRLL